jgi:class 3 adenylate cyclase/tetratricopeptide (TPR) repeat protein
LRERGGLEGERRTVTVLFADTVGFTPLSEALGEEQVYEVMQRCVNCMMEAVHRYEGSVTSFTGDGLMAVFGAPIAHEDSARRAVAAALEMQAALAEFASDIQVRHGVSWSFRVGLNTGPVIVGKISDTLDMDYTAIGDTVNLAQRMESAAEPGTVYLTEHTYRLIGDYFECERLAPVQLKGKSEPVVPYRVLRERPAVRTRLQAAAERGLSTFVGRQQELNALQGFLASASRGQGQVVFVTGEAGLGKSRLLLEFRRSLDASTQWLEGHCISYGKKIPYHPISDVAKAAFGVEEGDLDARIIRRIEEATADWHEAARDKVPYLKYLLNVDPGDSAIVLMDPLERRAGIIEAVRSLVIELTDRGPLVILIEDLHWADEQSEETLRALIDTIPNLPVLMIIAYRTGHVHALGDRTYYSRLALGFLPEDESAKLAQFILDADQLHPKLKSLIAGKGEGNPFYIEELTKSLIEAGVLLRDGNSYVLARPDSINVPDTIQEIILSRIDRLEKEARDAIQLASVIGREFTVRLLNRIADVGSDLEGFLGQLKTLELIYEKAYFPELAYMFKHALTHDVAYSTLLAERRRSLHRMVGAAIEELYADRLVEHYEALAHHYYEGQNWEKALQYLEEAGDKATSAYANQEALDYYRRALEVCERIGPGAQRKAAKVAEKRGFVNFAVGGPDDAALDFERMRDSARDLGDRHLEGLALGWMGYTQCWGSDPVAGKETIREAIAISDEGYEDVRAIAMFWLGCMTNIYGDVEEGNRLMAEVDAIVPEIADEGTRGFWAFMGGMTSNWEARYDASLAHLEKWRATLDQTVFTTTGRLWNEGLSLSGNGEYSEALNRLHEALTICERTGEMLVRARVMNTIGWILGELQDHDAAMEWNKRSEETALSINAPDPEIESNARLNLGDNLVALGRLDEAEEYYAMVETVVRNATPREKFAVWLYSQHLCHSYGELWLERGDAEKALAYSEECIQRSESTNRPKNVIKGHRLRGQALMAQGNLADSEREIETALALAREVGNPPQLWKTQVALAKLREVQGRAPEAKAACAEALAVIEGVASGLDDARMRETFLRSPHVEAIRSAAA